MFKKITISIIIIVSFLACTETKEVEIPGEPEYPEMLSPYENEFFLSVFESRRISLMELFEEGSLVIVTTNDIYQRNGSIQYDFRPSSTFYYLTGFEEPNSVMVLKKTAAGTEMIMFVEERSEVMITWLGPVCGREGAKTIYGADEAYLIEQFQEIISTELSNENFSSVYANFEENQTIAGQFYNSGASIPEIEDIRPTVEWMRAIKEPIEISMIQNAIDVSSQAFEEVFRYLEPGMYEYEVEAIMNLILRLNGCQRTAYQTIVASGPNINTLHYPAGVRLMEDGDLVMIDFGAEYAYYSADITRTLPVNGTFTSEQRTVYNIVLDAHKAVIETVQPGSIYSDIRAMSREKIIDGLIENGIISGIRDEIISSGQYRLYIPAGLAHPVGLDVHDPFPEGIFRENMVLAFEPHVYLQLNDETVNPDYRGVSVRIEDVVQIRSNRAERLSSNLPYEIEELETLMN